jgi:hypothetical protein
MGSEPAIQEVKPGAKQAWLLTGLFCLFSLLSGCASFVPQTIELRTIWPADVPRVTELTDTPFFPQTEYQCGPAALATVLGKAGAKVAPDDLVQEVYLPGRKGSLQVEMMAAPRRHGLVGSQLPAAYDALLREVAAGRPVLVLQNLGFWPFDNWHYAVVVGFDYEKGELYLRSGATERQALPFTIFEVTWKRSGYWAMVVTPPGTIPTTATEATYLPALVAFERGATPAQSRTAWEAFQARWPGNALASIALSNRYYADRNLAKAIAVLRLAEQKNPESAEVLNNLAQMLSDQGDDDEALVFAERAAAIKGPFAAEAAATRAGIIKKLGGLALKLTDYSAFSGGAAERRPTSGQP